MDKEWTKRVDENTTQVRSCAWSAPGCHPVGCGLLLTIENGKLVKVEGDPEHPYFSRQAVCPVFGSDGVRL